MHSLKVWHLKLHSDLYSTRDTLMHANLGKVNVMKIFLVLLKCRRNQIIWASEWHLSSVSHLSDMGLSGLLSYTQGASKQADSTGLSYYEASMLWNLHALHSGQSHYSSLLLSMSYHAITVEDLLDFSPCPSFHLVLFAQRGPANPIPTVPKPDISRWQINLT